MSAVAPTLQAFFTDRLARQRRVSPQTVASYRDTFRLLLRFVHDSTGKAPSTLDWDDLDVEVISTFLDHLELERHNSARTRNLTPDRHQVTVPLRRALRPRARRRHPAGPRDPSQAL